MNTLEIARMTGKDHKYVLKSIKAKIIGGKLPSIPYIDNRGRNALYYILSDKQLNLLPYGKEVIQANHIEELEKRDKEQSARIKELEKANKDKDKKINQLEDALLAKTKSLDQVKRESLSIKKESREVFKFLEVSMAGFANREQITTIIDSLKGNDLPYTNQKDARRGMQAFHPDKNNDEETPWFAYFKGKHQELRQ